MNTVYINRYDLDTKQTETVSEYLDQELMALADLTEYRASESPAIAHYSLSSEPSKCWND